MTIIIGLLCQDGVVIGSDSSATFAAGNQRTIEHGDVPKISITSNRHALFASTGQAGFAQRFKPILQGLSEDPAFRTTEAMDVGKNLSVRMLQDLHSTGVGPGQFGAIVAYWTKKIHHLCEIQIADLQPELKDEHIWFVSMGCGQPIVDPFLCLIRKSFFRKAQPTLAEGKFVAAWALNHAIDVNTGGINGPPQIAVLEWDKQQKYMSARFLEETELQDLAEMVTAAEDHLADFRDILSGKATPHVAPPPSPPPAG